MKKDIIEIDFTSQMQASNDCDCGACDEEECGCPCHVANAKLDESIAFSVKVMETLATLTKTKTPCFFMHGNRDFLIGDTFTNATVCQLIEDPKVVEIEGNQVNSSDVKPNEIK